MEQIVVQVAREGSNWQEAFDTLAANQAEGEISIIPVQNAKKALKYLRKVPATAAIVITVAENDSEDLKSLTRSIRGVMHNQAVRILVCAEDSETSGSHFVTELGVNAVLPHGQNAKDRLFSQLKAELHTHDLFVSSKRRHQAETDLLTAIARFSRLELKLSECLAELARSTGVISNAVIANVIVVRRDGTLRRSGVTYQRDDIDATEFLAKDRCPTSHQLLQVVEESRLQLRIQADDPELVSASKTLNCEISGRFVFPLRSFGRTMCLVDCWLPADGLSEVSVDLVRLIEKSSEQFSLLFERKQADSQLKRQYKRLKYTLEELTSTKDALYHSEKLASIGQLAAGIAHEINNPVAYVMGNFNPLNDYVDTMSRMLELHNSFVDTIDNADVEVGQELRQQITKAGEDLDLEYVLEDVRALVDESKQGLLRVRDIILNLNEFARKDSVEAAPTDLNGCIKSTLNILNNELKQGIDTQLELGELPMVMCHSGLINQVILNLVKNGAQAMGGKGVLRISSMIDGENVFIRVRDQGSGMSDDVKEKIFEPFFTTKPVGEGTGLGLSLCHGIVERHAGKLTVTETGPDGTEFTLSLPIAGVPEVNKKII